MACPLVGPHQRVARKGGGEVNLLAIDPGALGGLAWLTSRGAACAKMPETRGDCIALVKSIVGDWPANWTAYHEKIAGFIPDGGASQMFEFGRSVERVGCILETIGVRVIEVTPQTWQAVFSLGKAERVPVPRCPIIRIPKDATPFQIRELKAEQAQVKRQFEGQYAAAIRTAKAQNARFKAEWKNKLKAEAQRRYPTLASTLKTADALLILEYGRLTIPR